MTQEELDELMALLRSVDWEFAAETVAAEGKEEWYEAFRKIGAIIKDKG